jgi:lipoate-protein ligase A
MNAFRLIVDAPSDARNNMAVDEALMLGQGRPESVPTLRFYTWSEDALSIGYFQSVREFDKPSRYGSKPSSVVRRLTGGGVVRHGHDLTFSITATMPNPLIPSAVKDSYLKINEAVRIGLKQIYPTLDYADCRDVKSMRERQKDRVCFEKPDCHDLLLNGKKILGASQRRIGNKFLHQSSLTADQPYPVLIDRLIEAFSGSWKIGFELSALTAEEKELASRIKRDRYSDPEWGSPLSVREYAAIL